MFFLRGTAVVFSILVMLYTTLSVAVCCVWQRVWLYAQRYSVERSANVLFGLRLLPCVAASAATLAFAVPSFLLLEPRTVDEPMGDVPIVLGLCGLAVVLVGMWKAAAALTRASRTVAHWSLEAREFGSSSVNSRHAISMLRISAVAPPLTAAGILRPRVWLSRDAEFSLTERELESALRHELAHIRKRDNLKKLILRLVAFPGMAELETTWREASEMGADDAAVSSVSEALDLASALIKLSSIAGVEPPAELTISGQIIAE